MKDLFNRIAAHIPKMPGWCSLEKANAMATMIVERKPAVVVEIGVFGGRSLLAMAFACQHAGVGRVHGIDPWTKEDALDSVQERENIEWWEKLDYETIYRVCLKAVIDQGVTGVCTIHRTTSERAVGLFDEVDLLHIDGNHSEVSSCRDVRLWLPKVKSGGHVWFDDIDWPSTAKALGMLVESCERLSDVGTCAVFRKP